MFAILRAVVKIDANALPADQIHDKDEHRQGGLEFLFLT